MPIEDIPGGGIIATGPYATRAFAYVTLAKALELEAHGLKLTRGPSMLARAKRITGLRTRDRAQHAARLREMATNLLAMEGTPDGPVN